MILKQISLKWKLFVTIFLFAALIAAVFIVFQITLLETIYRSNKMNRMEGLITQVDSEIKGKDLSVFKDTENPFCYELENVSVEEETAIYLYGKPKTTVYVTSGESLIIADKNLVYKTYSGSSFEGLDYELISEIWRKASDASYKKFYAIFSSLPDARFGKVQLIDMNRSKRMLVKDLSGRTESIMCCAFVELSDGNEYLLILDNKLIPVGSVVKTLKMQLTYIGAIVIVLSTIIAIFLSKYISKPIARLNATAKVMAKGNYDVVFEGNGYLEIDELNQTLNNTIEELRKTEDLRRELMANVSHDLRTPLTMITGYAEMMKDIPGENNPENLQIIIDEVNRLNLLVNDMLDLSKLSAKTVKMQSQTYCITDNIIDIVERIQKFNESTGIHIQFLYDQRVDVIADEQKIEQVIYNFIHNAINYSHGSTCIEVIQTVEQGEVKIAVVDHGIGIKAEDLSCIWDRYYRIDKAHHRSIQGSGLGLSIVKGILECHHFEYGVESQLGKGSTFWFKMPISSKN